MIEHLAFQEAPPLTIKQTKRGGKVWSGIIPYEHIYGEPQPDQFSA